MAKRDLWARWSKREDGLLYNWTGHLYDKDGAVVRQGGTKKDGMVLAEHLEALQGVLGTTLVEELEKRGYDITTLRFSISKKD